MNRPAPLTMPQVAVFSIAVFLCLWVVHTCLQIEIRNHLVGGILPRREPGEWRESPITTEGKWRWYESQRRRDPELLRGILVSREQAEMEADLRRNRATNALRRWVSSAGLLQYAAAPLALIMAITAQVLLKRRAWCIACTAMALLDLAAIVVMVYRNYCGSLG